MLKTISSHILLLALTAANVSASDIWAGSALKDLPAPTAAQEPVIPKAAPAALHGTVTIYAYPPRRIIDWSSPKAALAGFSATAFGQAINSAETIDFVSDFGEPGSIPRTYKSTMGHTIGHVNCVLPDGTPYDSWTSFSGQDFQEVDKELIFDKQAGLGLLYEDYIDGHIISGIENKLRLIYYAGKSGVSPRYLSQKIDAQACGRVRDMVEFFKDFHFPKEITYEQLKGRPEEKILYFTTNMDPYASYKTRLETGRGKVGGGCAPYGVALLKAAGKYDTALDPLLNLKLNISERLIGNIPDGLGGIRRVPLRDLLGTLGESWRHSGYPEREFKNYDPYLIWKFVGEVRACLSGESCGGDAAGWLAANKERVSTGAAQRLSDKRTVETNSYGDSGPSYTQVTRDVTMEGIVLE
ncbi:MAG: hypothetical protein NDI60_08710 [Elusimicrobiales bacterium]|nr:hypothetical protein [Elusimicrobiales bacterium]